MKNEKDGNLKEFEMNPVVGEEGVEIDKISGLPLFTGFRAAAEERLKQSGKKYAMLYLDFEQFRYLSKYKGIETGNRVLRQYGEFLQDNLQRGELVCRYFADVILVLLEYKDIGQLRQRIRLAYGMTDEWRKATFPNLRITVKIGVFAPKAGTAGLGDMIELAATAHAETGPAESFRFYDGYEGAATAQDEAGRGEMVRRALENGSLKMYFQPVYNIRGMKLVGAAAFVGWSSEQEMPDEMKPLFEGSEFVRKPDYAMCDKLFSTVRKWLDDGKALVPVIMEITEENMSDPTYFENLAQMIERYGLPPYSIEMELREHVFYDGDAGLMNSISKLRRLGVTFAVDSFSRRISSLEMGKEIPVDELKLGKDFFGKRHLAEKERSVLGHMVRMAKSLDMTVRCADVMNEEQGEMMMNTGCDRVQGDLYERALPVEEFTKLLPDAQNL